MRAKSKRLMAFILALAMLISGGMVPDTLTGIWSGIIPNAPTYVYANTVSGNSLTVAEAANGVLTATPAGGSVVSENETKAVSGNNITVTVSANPDEGYKVKSLKYNDANIENDQFTLTENTTVTAEFEGIGYTVKFNANGGTGTMSDLAMVYGTSKNLTANAFTYADHTFTGWATSTSGAKVYDDKASVNNLTTADGSTYNLYAVWSESASVNNSLNLTVAEAANGVLTATLADGSEVSENETKAVSGNNITVTVSANPDEGYKVKSLKYNDANIANNQFTLTENTTVTAEFEGIGYTVKFNANGGTGTMSDLAMVYGTSKNLTANAFTYADHTFTGWATSTSGAKVYDDKASVNNLTTTDGNTYNLYAVWSESASVNITAKDNMEFVEYDGSTIDLSDYFDVDVPENYVEGTDYTISYDVVAEGSTGAGSVSGKELTVTKAGDGTWINGVWTLNDGEGLINVAATLKVNSTNETIKANNVVKVVKAETKLDHDSYYVFDEGNYYTDADKAKANDKEYATVKVNKDSEDTFNADGYLLLADLTGFAPDDDSWHDEYDQEEYAGCTLKGYIAGNEVSEDDSLEFGIFDITNKKLYIHKNAVKDAAAGDEGAVVVNVAAWNYIDYTITVYFTVTGAEAEVSFTPDEDVPELKGADGDEENLNEIANEIMDEHDINVKLSLEIEAVAEDNVDAEVKSSIKDKIDSKFAGVEAEKIGKAFLDITIKKTVTDEDGKETEEQIPNTPKPVKISVKFDLTGKSQPIVIREHEGNTTVFKKSSTATDATFTVSEKDENGIVTIDLFTDEFSTYAIAYLVGDYCNVTYIVDNEEYKSEIVANGEKAKGVTNPTKASDLKYMYVFKEWQTEDGKTFNFDTAITTDIILYAYFTKTRRGSSGSSSTGSRSSSGASSATTTTPATTVDTGSITVKHPDGTTKKATVLGKGSDYILAEEAEGVYVIADAKTYEAIKNAEVEIANEGYIADENGIVKSGFFKTAKGDLVYGDPNNHGAIVKGRIFKVGKYRYCALATGRIVTKDFFTTEKGNTVYANAKGRIVRAKVFTASDGNKYYAAKNGKIVKGKWINYKGSKYYCSKNTGKITKTK